MLRIVLIAIIAAMATPALAQYGGWGIYGPNGRPPPGAYEAPPCNPYYNPDCGRFSWEGPRSRAWRCQEHPMMPDCPRGPGAPYEGRPGQRPFYDDE